MKTRVQSLIAYRGFISGSVRREFEARYQNSLLGLLWSMLTPLSSILIYTLIFTNIMKTRLAGVDDKFAYSIYICAGVLTWGMFSEVITRCQNIFVENANMLKKLSFPRLCLPVIVVCSSLINLFIVLVLFMGFLLLTGKNPGIPLLALVPLVTLQVMFAVALGIFVGVINVFFRDAAQFTGIMLQFWFWFTPIVYPLSILPDWVKDWVMWNPMTHLAIAYQKIFVYSQWPDWSTLQMPLVLTIIMCGITLRLYRRRAGEMVDEL